MAVDFKAEHSRSSEYLFPPEEIEVKPEFNGRFNLPEIDTLIESFLSVGQLQPVLIGNDGGRPVLYAGHRRWRAALEINKRKLGAKPFKLRCVYFRGDEKTAFLATISENHERKQTDEIDDAHNIAKLEQVYAMSHQEIASVYREDLAWVQKRLALLDLTSEAAEALRGGRMKLTAAVAIAKLSKTAQRERIKAAGDGKITAATVKELSNGTCPKPRKPRELREFWKPYSEQKTEDKLTRFASAQLAFMDGGDPEEFFATVRDLLG